jgi:endoglucanase
MQLATVPSALPERDEVGASLVTAADAYLASDQPFGQLYAPPDGRYAWGSNGMVANCAAIVAAAFEVGGDHRHRDGALAGIDYLLGRNALGISYVTGHGTTCAHHQHSRWFAAALDPSLPDPPPGSLAGGPNSDVPDPVSAALAGQPAQCCYVDDIGAFGVNEMAINWNSALAWLAAFAAGVGDGL